MQRVTALRSVRPRTDAVSCTFRRALSSTPSQPPNPSLSPTSTSPSPSSDPPLSPPTRIGVIGGGQMGTGIAYVSSVIAHLPVTIVDSSAAQLQRSRAFISSLLDKDHKKGRIDAQQKAEALQRFTFTPHIQQVPLPSTHTSCNPPLFPPIPAASPHHGLCAVLGCGVMG